MKRFLPILFLALFSVSASRSFAQATAADIIVSDDFESTAVGQIPVGFTKTGAIAVAEDVAHSGKHSLKIEPAVKGGRFLSLSPEKVAALGGEHWGRLYFKVKTPPPAPVIPEGKTTASIHCTLVAGKAISPLANDPIELRLMGWSLNSAGAFRYMYNVQPKGRQEFGANAKQSFPVPTDWTLAEWHVDHATQTYQFFVNGVEIPDVTLHKGGGQFAGVEIPPAFQSYSIGFTNYQAASGEGFTVWLDDIALAKKRLGPVTLRK